MASKVPAEIVSAAGRDVTISNPHKVLFPKTGHTKLDLVRYYLAVADEALRGSGGRPNVLVRYPNGVGEEFFFQKRAPQSRPDWIDVAELRFPSGRTAEEVVPRDAAALATSKWWKEERHGVFLDYNQNAKDPHDCRRLFARASAGTVRAPGKGRTRRCALAAALQEAGG